MKIKTWMLPQFAKNWFGGEVECTKEEDGYVFTGSNGKEVHIAGKISSREARSVVCRMIAEETQNTDGRVSK